MKKFIIVGMMGLAVTMAAAMAEDVTVSVNVAAPETVTLQGTVVVETDEAGEVACVKIQVSDEQMVAVALDETGKKLAELKGQKVEVVGEKDGEELEVKSFKALPQAS